MKIRRSVFISIMGGLSIVILLLSGFAIYKEYGSKLPARQIILQYYQDFQAGDDESIYKLLHPESREKLGKENIMAWMEQLRETIELESYEIKDIQLKATIKISDNSITDGISIQVAETNRDLYTSETLSSDIQYFLLRNDQGEPYLF